MLWNRSCQCCLITCSTMMSEHSCTNKLEGRNPAFVRAGLALYQCYRFLLLDSRGRWLSASNVNGVTLNCQGWPLCALVEANKYLPHHRVPDQRLHHQRALHLAQPWDIYPVLKLERNASTLSSIYKEGRGLIAPNYHHLCLP